MPISSGYGIASVPIAGTGNITLSLIISTVGSATALGVRKIVSSIIRYNSLALNRIIKLIVYKGLMVTAGHSSTVKKTLNRTLSTSMGHSSILASSRILRRTLTYISTHVSTMAKTLNRTLSVISGHNSLLAKTLNRTKLTNIGHSSILVKTLNRTLSVLSGHNSLLVKTLNRTKLVSATHVSIVKKTLNRTKSVISTHVSTVKKTLNRTLTYVSSHVSGAKKTLNRTLTYVSSHVNSLSEMKLYHLLLSTVVGHNTRITKVISSRIKALNLVIPHVGKTINKNIRLVISDVATLLESFNFTFLIYDFYVSFSNFERRLNKNISNTIKIFMKD